MRPRKAKAASKTKAKAKVQPKPVSSASDDNEAFQSPEHQDETDYGLEFTTSNLTNLNTTAKRHPSSTMNKPQRSRQHDSDSYDDDDDEENQPPAASPSRQLSDRPTQQKFVKDTSNRNTAKEVQEPQQRQAPKPITRRKQKRPEHRLVKLQREIQRLQESDRFLIPRLPFSRLVREIMCEHTIAVFKITVGALEALQTSTELYLTQRFEDAYLLTQYRGRVTLEVRDMALVAYFCRTYGNN